MWLKKNIPTHLHIFKKENFKWRNAEDKERKKKLYVENSNEGQKTTKYKTHTHKKGQKKVTMKQRNKCWQEKWKLPSSLLHKTLMPTSSVNVCLDPGVRVIPPSPILGLKAACDHTD